MDRYDGWRGASIVLAGIFLNMIVCGLVFRELDWKKKPVVSRASSARSITSQMPEIEDLRLALESGDVSELIEESEAEMENVNIASSLVTIPTYVKDPSKLPEDVLTLLIQNKKTYDFIVQNFPESLTDKSSNDSQVQQTQGVDQDNNINIEGKKIKSEPSSTKVKIKRRMSSLLKGQKSILKKKEPEPGEAAGLQGKVARRQESGRCKQTRNLHNLKIRRQSMIYRGACLSTPLYHMRASSCPDIFKNTMDAAAPAEESLPAELLQSISNCCSFQYITSPFVLFCLSNFLLYFW